MTLKNTNAQTHKRISVHPSHSYPSIRKQIGDGLLSIIMPVHNLGPVIAANVLRVYNLFSGEIPFEIIVVNDGSTDNTPAELEQLQNQVPALVPVTLEQNMGKGEALRQGFQHSRGNFVLLLDGDLDLPPEQASSFFEIMQRENSDVVIGSKRHPDSVLDYPLPRRVMSAAYYGVVKILFGLPVRDTQTGLKLFKREVLEYVLPRMLIKHFAFDLEILAIANDKGYRITEAPVTVDFHDTAWGCATHPKAVKCIIIDTLAIFYRLKILHYYQEQ